MLQEMTINQFMSLPEFSGNETNGLKQGDLFLSGQHMINQKYNKKPPMDIVSCFEVYEITDDGIIRTRCKHYRLIW